ncbi:MAG: phosphate signaling complex PhoU family protein [Candidatus Melainabacteria bacterium]
MEHESPNLTTRVTLTRELGLLKESVSDIGNDCCTLLALSTSSFTASSDFLEKKAKEIYQKVRSESDNLESHCFTILSLQQPLLKDLRLVVGVLRIAAHLTRIASYSSRLVNISGIIHDKSSIPADLVSIAENCNLMLRDVIKAFHSGSTTMALELVKKDKENDLLHDSSFQKIIKRMTHEKAELVEIDAQMLTSVRFLERTGDTIAAIAKEVYFIYTGQKI